MKFRLYSLLWLGFIAIILFVVRVLGSLWSTLDDMYGKSGTAINGWSTFVQYLQGSKYRTDGVGPGLAVDLIGTAMAAACLMVGLMVFGVATDVACSLKADKPHMNGW